MLMQTFTAIGLLFVSKQIIIISFNIFFEVQAGLKMLPQNSKTKTQWLGQELFNIKSGKLKPKDISLNWLSNSLLAS